MKGRRAVCHALLTTAGAYELLFVISGSGLAILEAGLSDRLAFSPDILNINTTPDRT